MSVGQCGIPGAAGVLQASSFSAAHASLSQQLAAQAAAVAAAASQHQLGVPSLQPQTSHSSSGSLSCSPSIPVTANGTPNSSLLAMSSLSSSPAAKKFRPAYARPSSKSQRYIPKPLPAELGNLKLYSKFLVSLVLSWVCLVCDMSFHSLIHKSITVKAKSWIIFAHVVLIYGLVWDPPSFH